MFSWAYKTYFSGIVIYISFDLYNADSNKENPLFQRLRDIEKYEKTESRSRLVLLITFVWVINMLFLIPLPKLLEDPSEKQDKTQDEEDVMRLRTSGTIPTGK